MSGAPRFGVAVPAVVVIAALVLIGGNAAGRPGLAAAVIVVQVVLAVAWLLYFSMTVESALIVGFAVAIADVVLLRTRAATGGSIAGVLGLSVIAVLFHQVARRGSRGVTESVAITLSAIVLAVAAGLLLPLRELDEGRSIVLAGVVTAAAALVAVRLLPGPDHLRRALGLAAAVLAGLLSGLPRGGVSPADAIYLGLATGVTVLLLDRLFGRIPAERPADGSTNGVSFSAKAFAAAAAFVTGLVPLVLSSPIAYLAGRIIASGGG